MTEEKVYDYILDGSNILHENKQWGDQQIELDGVMLDAINIDRLKKALVYFEEKGRNVLVCVDAYTLLKVRKNLIPCRTSKNQFNKFFKDKKDIVVEIQTDYGLIEQRDLNPGAIIITNDSFKSWIQGDDVVEGFGKEDWKAEAKKRKEFGFREGEFTLARKNYKFTTSKELANKPKEKKIPQAKKAEGSDYLSGIRSCLQSLDDRTQSQTTKINNINSIVQDLNTLVQEIVTSSTKSNSSALIPCKFEDEFGQSHLCLLGENLHIWQDGKWIEIAIGESTKLLD